MYLWRTQQLQEHFLVKRVATFVIPMQVQLELISKYKNWDDFIVPGFMKKETHTDHHLLEYKKIYTRE